MNSEKSVKKGYDEFGKTYHQTRVEKRPERAFNEFLELPAMLKAVGNPKNKKLLDVGCGAGIHAKKYLKKGAKVWGIDISKTMIDLARKQCPFVEFKVGSVTKLPYPDSYFDIVTASLSLGYLNDLVQAFKEISRVLKKGGLFYYSRDSIIWQSEEHYEDKNIKIKGIGEFIDKKSGKRILLGKAWTENPFKWTMVSGMILKTYPKTLSTQLKSLISAGFELIDVIDCKPVKQFKKHNPRYYSILTKVPAFSIYVSKKK